MPGIDSAEPERTDTSSGLSAAPNFLLVATSSRNLVRHEIVETGFRRDHESRRHIEADLSHLAQIGTLAAKQFLVLAVTFGE